MIGAGAEWSPLVVDPRPCVCLCCRVLRRLVFGGLIATSLWAFAAPGVCATATFSDASAESGLEFMHTTGATGQYYFPEINASGCALFDYDNDGDLDAYLIQCRILEPGKSVADLLYPYKGPNPPRNRLFRNELISKGPRAGKLRFVDVTDQSGAGLTAFGMGAATGDVDNDGDLDLYVTNFGPDVLLRNNGDGTFTDATAQAGLGDPRWTSSASFLDYDNDGWLDLFVAAYADFTVATNKPCYTSKTGARDYCGPKAYPPLPGRLYRNQRNGKFLEVTAQAGVDTAYGHGLGVVSGDFDKNGWQDLYVANDGDANQLWMNDRGKFTDVALLNGAALNEHGMPEAGMGIAVADYDDDGDIDFFVTHLVSESNTLFENQGRGMYVDATARRGVGPSSLAYTAFGVGWFDLDNDGDLDLFIANGDVKVVEALAGQLYPYDQPDQILINVGRGKYEDMSAGAGDVMKLSEVGRGTAFGDVDNDGDIDILVSNNNGPARLLRNDLADKQNFVELRVIDKTLKRDLLGASVRLTLGDGRVLSRFVRTDGSYMSANDPRVHVAWPGSQSLKSVELVLPDLKVIPVKGVAPGMIATVEVGATGAEVRK